MKTILLLCLSALAPWPAAAQTPNVWLASFDQVWQTIKDRHWDPERKGASWDAARTELRPRIEQAASADEARAILGQLLARLGQSHFGIIPAEAYSALASGRDPGDASPGFDVRMVEGAPTVTRVLPNSPAARAGIRPGWLIRRIGSADPAPVLERFKDSSLLQNIVLARRLQGEAGDSLDLEFETAGGSLQSVQLTLATPDGRPVRFGNLPPMRMNIVLARRLQGEAGDSLDLEFETAGGSLQSVQLTLATPDGRPVRFGNLPPMRMNIERARPHPEVAHVRWNAFFEPQWLQDEFRAAVEACAPCRGFILDLRGNGGGLGILAPGVAGWFLDKQLYLGTMYAPTGPLKLVAYPRPVTFPGKLAILIDGLSASTSEFLAAGLKDLNRARLFGETTPGAALPSMIEPLPSGDRFQFAVADYISVGGDPIEGRGVAPHVAVPLTRAQLLEGRDPVLDAALRWILDLEEAQ